jgi:hypothetical protein
MRSTLSALDSTVPVALFTTLESSISQSLGYQPPIPAHNRVAHRDSCRCCAAALRGWTLLRFGLCRHATHAGDRHPLALSAQRGQVIDLILPGGLRLVAIGLALGPATAAGATRLIATLLYNVQALDPLIYGGVAVLFTVIAVLACLIPPLRASRIDPLVALRSE